MSKNTDAKAASFGFSLEVVYVDGRRERHEFLGDTEIGSSPEVRLCLPLDELSPQHLFIRPLSDSCWVSVARGVTTPVLLGGHPVDSQEVQWGAELDVGTITLRIAEPIEKVRAKEQGVRTALSLGLLVVGALVAFYMLQDRVVRAPRAPASAPELFGDAVETCGGDSSEFYLRGQKLENAATAYWERYPFDGREGIRAARLFGQASDCFAEHGSSELSAKMLAERQAIENRVNRDYQTLRLQLLRALAHREHRQAKNHMERLSGYVQHRPGKYLDWLGRVRRYLRDRA